MLNSVLQAQFYSLETENLRLIYYGNIHSYLVPHVAGCFENSLNFHRNLFDFRPREKVTVLLHDFGDYGNAGADVIPRNHIAVGIAPYRYVYETSPANERMNSTMNHELVHIVAMDKASWRDEFFRSLFFGKVSTSSDNPVSMIFSYLTTPRRYSPRWYHEGIAVFMETWMAGGLGRAQGAYDEMVFRTMVRDSSHFYDVVGLESEGTKIDFQVGVNSYLYGTRFMSYLAYHYGPESLLEWVSRTNDSKSYFLSQFKRTYGKSLGEAWSQWIKWENEFQQANLDSIRLYPVTSYRPISQKTLGSVSRAFYDSSNKKLYAAIRYPGTIAHIAAIDIDNGELEKICDIKGGALYYVSSLAYDQSTGTIFYTTDNNAWRDLRSVDVKTGKSKTLIKDARIGDLAFNQADRSIWGVRHYNGISTLARVPYPYNEWNQIYSWPYAKDIYDIDVSPDGRCISAALAEASGRQTLIMMDTEGLMEGDSSYITLYDFKNSNPSNFVFSPDGKYLYGSSYYTGVSNVFRYDFDTDSMEVISNCETGFFRPMPISDDSLIVFRYTGKGFVPVIIADRSIEDVSAIIFLGKKIVEEYPIVEDWIAGDPAEINIDSLTTYSGRYHGLQNMTLASAYPVIEGYKDFAAYGMRFNFSGPVGLHNSDVTASYTPSKNLPLDERWHVNFNYGQLDWEVSFKYNDADFYDLFGPTRTSRKGYSLGLQHEKTLLFDTPKIIDYSINIVGYSGLERLPEFQNIETRVDEFISISAKYDHKNLRQSLGAVDYEKGYQWQIISSNNYVSKKILPRIVTNYDYGFPLPLRHSSIWLRSSLGYSSGRRDEPFANFFLGGFGNNWVDYQTEKRYREYYAFPGVELNDIGGTNYGKIVVEWTLPPFRFRGLGVPAFYGSWARLALFSTGIATNLDSEAKKRTLLNIGSQLDFRIIMLSHLNLTLSLGYAAAFEREQSVSREFMFSLKIL